ncbi:hypothetical protein BT63DRAFT_333106 [Microthyrium microscopicum]|uniref:YCII-related domain-containing protein n=1 Tax=Microthyrium microscopicum TaxID=703497 RepID=A0A6A6U506_9PEZI|nr:hypothetical protein BT63DRAFT_333106 [Microthyrium microscopicum]
MPKYAILVGATAEAETGKPPKIEDMKEMGIFNDQLRAAGILLDADGFLDSSKGARISFTDSKPSKLEYGPFGLNNLVAGYWFWEVDNLEQAIEWANKIPFKEGRVEIRRVACVEDFGPEVAKELVNRKGELPEELAK